jgi:flagellar biosynthesis GTPase FlhF
MIDVESLIQSFGPTPYLYMLAALLIGLGDLFAEKQPRIRVYQAGIAVAVLIYLTVPRLFFSVPYTVLESIGLIAHSGAIAGIVFGLAGFVLHGHIIISDTKKKFLAWWQAWSAETKKKQEQRRAAENQARNHPNEIRRLARIDEEERQRRMQQEEEDRQIEEDRRSKETKKLRSELAINQLLDQRHRESLEELLGRYLDQDLPHHVYEARLEAIDEFTSKSVEEPSQPKFKSMAEVEQYFASQIAEIQQMNIERYEKESLISTLEMAKDAAVREFMMGY